MDLYTRRVLEEKTRKDGKSFLFYYLPFPYSSSGRARAHVRPNNIINFHGFLVITIIKFPRRIAARFIGELLRGELTSVVGRDGTGYRSNTGRVFRTLNEWRIARPREASTRGNARFLDETRTLDACKSSARLWILEMWLDEVTRVLKLRKKEII